MLQIVFGKVMLVAGLAVDRPFGEWLRVNIKFAQAVDYDMGVNVACAVFTIGVGTDQSLMPRKICLCIIVKDLSRFGRDYIGVGEYMEQIFPLLGVRLIAINDNYDSNNYKGTTLGIHHVAIIVSDYEKSKDFYVNKLGFAVVRENFRKERNDWKLDLCVGDGADAIELEIFAEPNPPKRVNRPEACGLRHLAFRVENVEATVEELAQMGIECEPIRLDSYTKKKMTFFFDPDGLPLELHE